MNPRTNLSLESTRKALYISQYFFHSIYYYILLLVRLIKFCFIVNLKFNSLLLVSQNFLLRFNNILLKFCVVKIYLDTNLKIMLLDYQNNYINLSSWLLEYFCSIAYYA